MVRKIRAKLVLQLRAEGLSGRAIAGSQAQAVDHPEDRRDDPVSYTHLTLPTSDLV